AAQGPPGRRGAVRPGAQAAAAFSPAAPGRGHLAAGRGRAGHHQGGPPPVPILISPAPVQGEGASLAIASALRRLEAVEDVDVIIVARGGGSLEDLWAFNEEPVARAIVGCRVPVISAVGHETDFTIADFAADLRAPTPSAAAELAVPIAEDLRAELALLQRR